MAPQLLSLVARDATSQEDAQKKLTPTLIVGIVIAVLIVVGLAAWLAVRALRKRRAAQRQEERGAAFLNVRGLVNEGDEKSYGLAMKGDLFSKSQMSESVVLPEKAVIRTAGGADAKTEIIAHYTAEGTLPRPFAPFMGSVEKLAVPAADDTSSRRASTASWISLPRNSLFVPSNRSSARSSVLSTSSIGSSKVGDKRKIRQIFNPVLPDELVISLGEQLTVVNSFEDGWCIVGRDSVFKPGEVELGAIPAWCFMKPVQGLRAERPMRTTSLGVTITMEPDAGARNDVMSWSNF
ncbi:hypothetical protein PHLGIDRAFT_28110 [Phlebiopsis gigantea 11061_1 CR5-6]|uniref:SH3 domain-containing protein n=1 Tax=Phlebiopsis gigantea (strain 11061_1 CR5-6) TaxID=745531 RepID=A0A0C3S5E4_PHLG1|nr:hypothetical protein PHLGIDRAFT_28110 [Phlebiopsis gigantea 11061_1 CR5-6]